MHKKGLNYFSVPSIACERIKIITDFDPNCIRHLREADRYTIKEIRLQGESPIILGLVHLSSKLYSSDDDQLQEASYFRHDLEESEKDAGHKSTIVCGDFNMNPFDKGMVSAGALNSIPCLKTAKSEVRKVKGKEFSFFYNPMWNLMGDYKEPPGTFFYRSPSYVSYYWHFLDQVILRPGISERLNKSTLSVLTKAGEVDFVDRYGKPKTSDHLPLFFSLEPNKEDIYEESMA